MDPVPPSELTCHVMDSRLHETGSPLHRKSFAAPKKISVKLVLETNFLRAQSPTVSTRDVLMGEE